MSKNGKIFLISVLSLFFLSGMVSAEYSNDVPTPTVVAPPKTSTPSPAPTPQPPAPEEPEQPRIKVTVPHISDDYETAAPTLSGASVVVRVFDSGTKKAISGATVKWYGAKYTTGGVTDTRGEAKIGQVMPGEAKITANAKGYATNSKTVRAKSSIKVQYFDIYLNKTAGIAPSSETPSTPTVISPAEGKVSISGIVYDKATKKPISGASVKLTGTGPGQPVINETSSDGNGRYVITGCPLGVAVKLIYSKESYNKEEMTRYIAKTATSYRQDAYLGKGAVETKKPRETKKPKREVETLKSGPGIHETDLELIKFALNGQPMPNEGNIIIESPADNNVEFRAQAINSGPAQTTTASVLYFARASDDGSEINDFPIDLQGEPGRIVEGSQTYIMPPGEYNVGAFVLPGEGNDAGADVDTDPNLMNNSIAGTIKLIARSTHADAEHPRSTDLAITTFTINGQPIRNNPIFHLDLDNEDLNVIISMRNNGPDDGTGIAKFFLYFEGGGEEPEDVDLSRVGDSFDIQGNMPNFPEGTYTLGTELAVPFGDTDPDLSNNTDSGTFTVIYDNIPGRGEPEHPEEWPRRKTDVELVSFTVENQAVSDNPNVTFPADGRPPIFRMSMRNSGPEELVSSTGVQMFQDGAFIYEIGPVDLMPAGTMISNSVSIAGIPAGPHVFKAVVAVPPFEGDDENLSNNTISGTVTFGAEAEPADAGPDGGPPDDGQPDGGQPDNGRPDGGQPDDGQPPQPGGGPGGRGPGGWNPPGGGVIPGGAGPVVPAVPDAGLFGGGVPQAMPAPVAAGEAPVMEAAQTSPVEHPRIGPGPEFIKEFFGQVLTEKASETAEKEEAPQKEAPAVKEKLLWLALAMAIISLFIILAVIAKKKKKKNGV